MKLLILFSCALAVASAGWSGHGGYHIPVIGHGGVPVETPEVQHARAAHLAALSDAAARAGPYNEWQDNGDHQDHNDYSEARYHGPHAYPTTHGIAHVTHDGVPIDTPEVAAAKAHHFGAVNEALSYAGHGGHHYRRRRGIYEGHHPHAIHDFNFYGVGHDGRPLDTPVVAHAKAAALAAYDEAAARNGVSGHAGHYGGHGGYYGGYAGVAAIHNGVPVDTPEVQHAKAAHFAAHAAARGHHY